MYVILSKIFFHFFKCFLKTKVKSNFCLYLFHWQGQYLDVLKRWNHHSWWGVARTGYHIHQNCNFENKRNTHILDIKTFICKGFYEAFIYKWNTLFSLEPLKNKRSYYFSTELKKNQTIKNIDQWKHVIKWAFENNIEKLLFLHLRNLGDNKLTNKFTFKFF